MKTKPPLSHRLHIDLPLLLGLLSVSTIGLLVLYSAGGGDLQVTLRQLLRFGVAFVVMLALAQLPPRYFVNGTLWLYLGVLVLLVLVALFGSKVQGAQRWIAIGPIKFQPSELAKIAMPLMVAYVLSRYRLPPPLKAIALAAIVIIIPTLLIARQPDLGTALLVASSGGFVLFLAGMGWRLISCMALLGVITGPVLWFFFMRGYQKQRVLTFLDPSQDPMGAGYHIIQSKIAIGSGGLFGKGYLQGTQSQLDFLPERSTDFIFAVFSEEFGLLGTLVLLSTYLFVVYRGLLITFNTQTSFGRLAAGGLIMTFFVYVFVNIGMVSGILPVVGLPLPLLSYGGSSMLTVMASFGIIMSFYTHRRMNA